jgi:hypothetical protein
MIKNSGYIMEMRGHIPGLREVRWGPGQSQIWGLHPTPKPYKYINIFNFFHNNH